MFGIGMPEFLLIMAIALIVIGPKKLPDLAKALGKALGEFKKATSDLKDSLEIDKPLSDVKRSFDNLNKDFNKKRLENSKDKKDLSKDSPSKEEISLKESVETTALQLDGPEQKIEKPEIDSEKGDGARSLGEKDEKCKV
jgi:sec-independent protein translocase protein TatB